MSSWETPGSAPKNIPEVQKELFKIEEADVKRALLQNPDVETCEHYQKWRNDKEGKLYEQGGSAQDFFDFLLQDARLLKSVGLKEAARGAFRDAIEAAEESGNFELVEKLEKEMEDA